MERKRQKVFQAMEIILRECIHFGYLDAMWGYDMTQDEETFLDEMMDFYTNELNLISDCMGQDFKLFVKQMYQVYRQNYEFFVSIFSSI
jgi:hypothetical protein